jgi:hypothetical protein
LSVSKSIRFDIFARDSFTCQYCGRRPPEVVLELDHIHPRAKGGTDEVINLITSCYDCNRGKSAKVISEVALRPDADLAFLKIQQEISEVKRFVAAEKKLAAMNKKLVASLQDIWIEYLTEDRQPTARVLLPWVKRYGADEVATSIKLAAPAYVRGNFGSYNAADKAIRYVGGILRNRDIDNGMPSLSDDDVLNCDPSPNQEEMVN